MSMILPSTTIYVLMVVSWLVLFFIKALRIRTKKGELSQNHFAETLLQTFGLSTLIGLFFTNFNFFCTMLLSSEPLIATESLIYSSFALGVMNLLLVVYFFYYPLPD